MAIQERRQEEALREVTCLLEGFVSFAWAIGPDCVAARAPLLQRSIGGAHGAMDGDAWSLSETETKGIVWRLFHKVGGLSSDLADTFDSCLKPHQVGLPHCSAHGLRKAGTKIAAENKATVHQLMSIYGWETQKQAELYTREATMIMMAAEAMR